MKLSTLFCALLFLSSTALFADTAMLSGNTAGGLTFNRPTETGALSFEDAVSYNIIRINVSQTGSYSLGVVASDPANFDTFIHLYIGNFNPAAPDNSAFLIGNDDRSANPALGSLLSSYPLNAADTYYLVVDGFFGSTGSSFKDEGAYTATVSGPGTVSLNAVPEPASILWGLSCIGLLTVRRRSNR